MSPHSIPVRSFTSGSPPHANRPWCPPQLFKGLQRGSVLQFTMKVSYVEIYNEQFRDLLRPSMDSRNIGVVEYK